MKGIYHRPQVYDMAATAASRRRSGALLGVAFGVAYGLVWQLGNRALLPGIPLYQPPAGPVGNALLVGALGSALGLLATWPTSTTGGIVLGSLAAASAIVTRTILQVGASAGTPAAVLLAIIFGVPVAWLAVPVIALLRWMAIKQVEARHTDASVLVRLRLPAAAVAVMAALAAFEILSPTARAELRRMDEMLAAAQTATSATALPAPLAGPGVTGFRLGQAHWYTLEWTDRNLDRFIELRPASDYEQHAAVIARFAGGYTVVCLYPIATAPPNCASYNENDATTHR